MASFEVVATSEEDAGFGIDNLAVDGASAPQSIRTMAALGDSYSSGEGLLQGQGLSYDCGTDLGKDLYFQDTTEPYRWGPVWLDGACDTRTLSSRQPGDLAARPPATYENRCHRHGQAYPVDISRALGVSDLLFVACSGATTANIGEIPWTAKPQYPNSPVNVAGGHTQLTDLQNFATKLHGDPDLITIGVGGNDALFASVAEHCILESPFVPCSHNQGFVNAVLDRVNGDVRDDLTATFTGLREDFPSSTLVAFGYVDPLSPAAPLCDQVQLGTDDVEFLSDQFLPALNQAVADAADAAGIAYVDPGAATLGHELCTSSSWFRGISEPIQQSFHPTQTAHQHIAQWFVAHYTDGHGKLLLHDPPAGADPIPPTLNDTPGNIVPLDVQTPSGGCLQGCAIELLGSGYAPGTVGTIVMHSDPVTLGSFTADGDGNVDTTVRIPAEAAIGPHLIEMDGTAPDGAPQWSTAGFDVVAPPTGPQIAPTPTPTPTATPPATTHAGPAPRPARARVTAKRIRDRLRLHVTCPLTASSACRVRIGVQRTWPARGGRHTTVVARRVLRVRRGRGRTVSIRSAVIRRHPRQLSITVRTTTSAGSATASLTVRQ
jgi:hypothetical protein